MTESSPAPDRASPGRSPWPFVVVGLLGLNVCVCAVTVYAATRNPAATTMEDNYYQRALNWDDEREAWQTPAQAGWVISASASMRDARPILRVEIDGRDAAEGLRAEVFHRAKANVRHEIVLVRTPEGVYEAVLPEARAGLWEVRARDEASGVKFSATANLPSGA